MSEGVIVLDMENHVIDANPSALRMMGSSSSQLIGQRITDHTGNWGHLAERYNSAMEVVDEITMGESQTQQWFELRLSPLHNRQKNIVGKVIIITSITDRKRIEILLRESEARYRQIVENASEIIYRTDVQGYLTYANLIALESNGIWN